MERDAIDFEKERVPLLFRKLLIPTLLGTISISAVTAIDGIFVGHGVGADGVAAVNIVVPIYQIISGLGLMIGAGCSVVASIHLSRQNTRVAQLNISQAIILTSLLTFLLCVSVMTFPEQTARLLGSSDTLMPQVVDYIHWIMPCFVFDMWSMIGLFIIRLDGSPRYHSCRTECGARLALYLPTRNGCERSCHSHFPQYHRRRYHGVGVSAFLCQFTENYSIENQQEEHKIGSTEYRLSVQDRLIVFVW